MNKNKTILFYMGHPAHYHNVSRVMPSLAEKGHQIFIFARGKDVLFELIEDLPYQTYLFDDKKKENSRISLILAVLKREFKLFKILLKQRVDLLVGTDIVITHLGRILGIPSILLNEDDAESVPLLARYGFKYSTYTLSPDCCDISPYNHKKISYNSYHELAYLHPNHFQPKKEIVQKYIDLASPYFIMRFSKLSAHHDDGIQGINDKIAERIIDLLKPNGKIIINSERVLSKKLEPYRIQIDPSDIHHVMAFANLYVGDSQTMAAEAGVLGTPFIRFNDFVGRLGYLDELENTYNLGYGFKTENPDQMIAKIHELVTDPKLKNKHQVLRKEMLNEKIDFAAFLTWFIDRYPESFTDYKKKENY